MQVGGGCLQHIARLYEQTPDAGLNVANLKRGKHAPPAAHGVDFGLLGIATKGSIGISYRSMCNPLDAIIVQLVFDESANARQRFPGILH